MPTEPQNNPPPPKTNFNSMTILSVALTLIVGAGLLAVRGADPTIIIVFVSGIATQIFQVMRASAADAEKRREAELLKKEVAVVKEQTNGVLDKKIQQAVTDALAAHLTETRALIEPLVKDVAELKSKVVPPVSANFKP